MGAKLVNFKFKANVNEQIEALIKVPEERRSVIHGVVVDWFNKPVKDAVVKLFMIKDSSGEKTLCAITHTFTDKYGQFLFGPLCPNTVYVIKVWFNDVKIRPITIIPDPYDDYCLKCDETKTECDNQCWENECDDFDRD